DVLADFSTRMQNMYDEHMENISGLLTTTTAAMHNTAARLAALAANIDTAGKRTVDAMAERLNYAITSLEARQRIMNEQMGQFVDQIKQMLDQTQAESVRTLQAILSQIEQRMESFVTTLRQQGIEFTGITTGAVQTLSSQVEKILAQSVETNRTIQHSIERLSETGKKAIDEINEAMV
ncbi:MAG: hypothetical protein ACK4XK_09165, partial [Casimicrobiaceae bacterium]